MNPNAPTGRNMNPSGTLPSNLGDPGSGISRSQNKRRKRWICKHQAAVTELRHIEEDIRGWLDDDPPHPEFRDICSRLREQAHHYHIKIRDLRRRLGYGGIGRVTTWRTRDGSIMVTL